MAVSRKSRTVTQAKAAQRPRRSMLLLTLGAALAFAAAVGLAVGRSGGSLGDLGLRGAPGRVPGHQIEPPEPVAPTDADFGMEYDPILDATTASDRSLARFPVGHSPGGILVRLQTRARFEAWDAAVGPATAEAADWGHEDPRAPVWIVAILGSGLSVADVLSIPGGGASGDLRPAIGAYYGWDAASGLLLAQGALIERDRYTELEAMANASLEIRTATPPAFEPLATAPPTPTWEPAELATAVMQLTEQAPGQGDDQ